MDALDVHILRALGVKPFVAWPRRAVGPKPTDVARALGRSVQVVKERIARMEKEGVIAGYRAFPNLRHCGLGLGQFHFRGETVPQKDKLSGLVDVDGLVGVLWFYGGDLCIDVSYASEAERARRLDLIARLLGSKQGPFPLYERAFPPVERPLTQLDWRILRAMKDDARRPLPEVADEVGVTVRTVRTRLQAMRRAGSVDEHVLVNYERMTGVIPFNLGAWIRPGSPDPTPRLVELFRDRYLILFPRPPPQQGPPTVLLQLFAYTPAEIQSLLAQAMEVEGVEKVGALMPTGGYANEQWLTELVEAHAEGVPPPLPRPALVASKREILS